MSGSGDQATGSRGDPSDERSRVLSALGNDELSGPAIFRRMAGPNSRVPGGQGLFYPALYGLVASWRLRARWQTDPSGIPHRVYRRERFGFPG